MSNPLADVRVADFSQMGQGGIATQKLGDMGADVVKIEPPRGDLMREAPANGEYLDRESIHYLSVNRNKRSITLDLKTERGREVAERIVSNSDIVFENFRPGVMAKFGLAYEDVRAIDPEIIYVSGSGFGPSGPYAEKPGQDILIQAISGLAANTGRTHDPPTPTGAFVCDYYSAAMLALHAVIALYHREITGKGQKVEGNLLNSSMDFQGIEITAELNLGKEISRSESGIGHPLIGAPYGIFQTEDGFVALSFDQVEVIAEQLDITIDGQLDDDKEMFERRDEIKPKIEHATLKHPTDELVQQLADAGVWVSPVKDHGELVTDPQVQHNDMIVPIEHPQAGQFESTGIPIEMSELDEEYDPPPSQGQHTEEILREIGYSEAEVGDLRSADIVYTQ